MVQLSKTQAMREALKQAQMPAKISTDDKGCLQKAVETTS